MAICPATANVARRAVLVFGNLKREEAWARTGNAVVVDFSRPFRVGRAGGSGPEKPLYSHAILTPPGSRAQNQRDWQQGKMPAGKPGRYAYKEDKETSRAQPSLFLARQDASLTAPSAGCVRGALAGERIESCRKPTLGSSPPHGLRMRP
jgi:hypothetical protein